MRKSVFITGGSRGIGAACVKKFAEEGWNVAFTYRENKEAAEKVVSSAEKNAGEGLVISIPLDLYGESQAVYERLADQVKNAQIYFGIKSFDACVCNAGISISGVLPEISPVDVDNLINVNLKGSIMTAKAVLPNMISEKKGSIVLISSVWGVNAASCETVYAASKAGLIGFGKSLAEEVGPSGIRVNIVAPGVIDTDMNKGYTADELDELKRETPLGRIGAPSEVADSVFFLCDDNSAFVTGQVLGVDGGFGL